MLQSVALSGTDTFEFKGESSIAMNLLHSRCAELEEEKRLLQNEIQVQAIVF